MSSAVLERIAEQPTTPGPVLISGPAKVAQKVQDDPYPLLPVFIAGAISLVLAGMFIGSILVWLSLRHSGVMAP